MKTQDLLLIGGAAVLGYYAYRRVTGQNIFAGIGQAAGETTGAIITGTATGFYQGAIGAPLEASRADFWRGFPVQGLPNPFTEKVLPWF